MSVTVSIRVQTLTTGFQSIAFQFDTAAQAITAKTKGIWVERLEIGGKHIMLCFYLTSGSVSKRGKCSFLPFVGLRANTYRINVADRFNFQQSAFRINAAIA